MKKRLVLRDITLFLFIKVIALGFPNISISLLLIYLQESQCTLDITDIAAVGEVEYVQPEFK